MLGVCFFESEPRPADDVRPCLRDWNDLRKAFSVDQMMFVDPFITHPEYPTLTQFTDLSTAMSSTNVPWVFVEYNEPGAISLPDFTHPTDVVYCFGSDREGLDSVDRQLGSWLSIPTQSALWSNQAAAVVLGNRQF